jgi:hypothetical protein
MDVPQEFPFDTSDIPGQLESARMPAAAIWAEGGTNADWGRIDAGPAAVLGVGACVTISNEGGGSM